MQRRNFLWTSVLGTGLTVLPPSTSPQAVAAEAGVPGDLRNKAKLRFSSQLGIIPGTNEEEKLKNMKNWGFEAVELGGIGNNVDNWKKKVEDAGLLVSVFCFGSNNGDLCSDVVEKRQPGIDNLKRQLEGNAKLGGTGVIYVPAFNGQTKLTNQEIHKLLLEFLPEVGKFAVECGTKVVLEPLSRWEAFFLRQVGDAARIAKDCNKIAGCDGIGVMGDFYHMYNEEADDMGAFISGGPLVHHVHLANGPKRTLPGQEEHSFVQGFRGLKYIGYDKFVSFECAVRGDDKETEVRKSLDFLRSEWEKS
ncbi:MAG: sugar phosphate isomerase/epimerase [Planctomycetaceae bacterium]|nr:sugar phosphate isomerase/epimerase [Planctomycetaceae bacterium]